MPEGMSREELVELLSRLTIHIDHELAKLVIHDITDHVILIMWSYRLAFTSLQNMITNYPSWGHDIARGYYVMLL